MLLGLMASSWAFAQTLIPFWHTVDPPGRTVLEALVTEFNAKQNDYKIDLKYVGDLREGGIKLLAALRANSAPAIYYAEVASVARAIQDEAVLPLDAYIGNLPADFYPNLLEMGKFRGKTYALPVELQVPVLFYNADQLGARNIAIPKTWDDVAAAAQRLTSRASRGFILSSDIYSFNALIMSRGGSLVTKDGKPDFTSPKVVEALVYLQNIVRKGWGQSRPIAESQFLILDFLRTKAMMVVGPITVWPVVENRTVIPFKMGVAPIPRTPEGKVPLSGGTLVAIRGATDAQIKGMVAFWRYWTEPPNMVRWVKATYALPLRKNAQTLLEDFYNQDPRRRVALSQAEGAQRWIQDPEATIWYSYLEDALERAIQGGMDAKQSLEQAEKQALAVEKK